MKEFQHRLKERIEGLKSSEQDLKDRIQKEDSDNGRAILFVMLAELQARIKECESMLTYVNHRLMTG